MGEKQVLAMKDFAKEHISSLSRLWSSVQEGVPSDGSLIRGEELWKSTEERAIELRWEPYEETHFLHVIKTDNILYNKITTVFASLIDEIDSLIETVRKS